MFKTYRIVILTTTIVLALFSSCGSKSNKRAVSVEDLDKIMEEEAANARPAKSIMSAADFIELSKCGSVSCVQLFMKDMSQDFLYAQKGEYFSNNRGVVLDSAGAEKIMAFSTVFFDVNPGATWRLAHTVHKKELSDELLNDFGNNGFVLNDSIRYYATQAKCYRFTSGQYPGAVLYYSPTHTPWYSRGIYLGSTWACYVFEIHWSRE